MSIYKITDITVAGAYCNAVNAARESDRCAARRQPQTRSDTGKTEIPVVIPTALRRIARLLRYSGPRQTAAATR